MNEYYVYLYLRESDGTPYYVGKGKEKRYKKDHGRVNIPPNEDNIIFVKENMTNEEACLLEIELIAKYGRKDLGTGILQNQTDGGDGGDTSKSEGYQKFYKEKMLNKDSDYIKNISERMKVNNPSFSEKHRNRQSWLVISSSGEEFTITNLKSFCKKNGLSSGHMCRVSIGARKHHKGWNCFKLDDKGNQIPKTFIKEEKIKTEEDFYKWIEEQNLFSYDPSKNCKRPNGRVKALVDKFGKTKEFYGEYFTNKENKKAKSWHYYKDCSEEEFLLWIKKQSLYRKDGYVNPRIYSVIKHRGLLSEYYQ